MKAAKGTENTHQQTSFWLNIYWLRCLCGLTVISSLIFGGLYFQQDLVTTKQSTKVIVFKTPVHLVTNNDLNARTLVRLQEQRVSLNFKNTPISECLNSYRTLSKLNFVVAPDAQDIFDGESLDVTLKIKTARVKITDVVNVDGLIDFLPLLCDRVGE